MTEVYFLPGTMKGVFPFATVSKLPETHPAYYPVGTKDFLPRVKWWEFKADHSPPTNAKVKTAWRYTSTPIHLHGMVLS
jgi:hypothetical protein